MIAAEGLSAPWSVPSYSGSRCRTLGWGGTVVTATRQPCRPEPLPQRERRRGVRPGSATGCIRRVWAYPADWRTLGDAGLTTLTWQR